MSAGQKNYYVEAEHLSLENDAYVDDLGRFLNEKLGVEIVREGTKLRVVVDSGFSKRKLKMRVKRFLHITDLKQQFRVLAVPGEPDSYMVHKLRQYA
ncbi:MAG: hypothetical protein Kow0069_37380 [Promethearchaeota archaeon]